MHRALGKMLSALIMSLLALRVVCAQPGQSTDIWHFPDVSVGRICELAPNQLLKVVDRGVIAKGDVRIDRNKRYIFTLGQVEETGCRFFDQLPQNALVSIDARGNDGARECLAHLRHISSLQGAFLDDTPIQSGDLLGLASSRSLVTLSICSTGIDGDGLKIIAKQFAKLRALHCAHLRLTDASLKSLARLRYLEDLKISYCKCRRTRKFATLETRKFAVSGV